MHSKIVTMKLAVVFTTIAFVGLSTANPTSYWEQLVTNNLAAGCSIGPADSTLDQGALRGCLKSYRNGAIGFLLLVFRVRKIICVCSLQEIGKV